MTRTGTEQQVLYTPLAARMRPKLLDEFVGHADVLGAGSALRRSIEDGAAGSLILWGPPGVGKTTLAEIIARSMNAAIERISAVAAGVKDLREVLDRAQEWRKAQRPTVLIVDEIHRFNKAQQDVLLPAVEEGLVTLIGATTENPYFEVVSALVSRAEVVRLEPLRDADMHAILDRGLRDHERGLGGRYSLDEDAQDFLIAIAGGDARRMFNILDRAARSANDRESITRSDVESASQQHVVQYDKAGDAHYDTISAFIKSMRGSDVDAALFYLFRMLLAGEDPKFIVRRMYIFASEDIGNADPHALMLVNSCAHALEWVGLPEAEYNVAHAATYLAAAPKSNAVTVAMHRAKHDVRSHGNDQPPGHITNAPIQEMKQHGKGVGYVSAHDDPVRAANQQYRPASIQGNVYYEPGDEGFERKVKDRVDRMKKIMGTR